MEIEQQLERQEAAYDWQRKRTQDIWNLFLDASAQINRAAVEKRSLELDYKRSEQSRQELDRQRMANHLDTESLEAQLEYSLVLREEEEVAFWERTDRLDGEVAWRDFLLVANNVLREEAAQLDPSWMEEFVDLHRRTLVVERAHEPLASVCSAGWETVRFPSEMEDYSLDPAALQKLMQLQWLACKCGRPFKLPTTNLASIAFARPQMAVWLLGHVNALVSCLPSEDLGLMAAWMVQNLVIVRFVGSRGPLSKVLGVYLTETSANFSDAMFRKWPSLGQSLLSGVYLKLCAEEGYIPFCQALAKWDEERPERLIVMPGALPARLIADSVPGVCCLVLNSDAKDCICWMLSAQDVTVSITLMEVELRLARRCRAPSQLQVTAFKDSQIWLWLAHFQFLKKIIE